LCSRPHRQAPAARRRAHPQRRPSQPLPHRLPHYRLCTSTRLPTPPRPPLRRPLAGTSVSPPRTRTAALRRRRGRTPPARCLGARPARSKHVCVCALGLLLHRHLRRAHPRALCLLSLLTNAHSTIPELDATVRSFYEGRGETQKQAQATLNQVGGTGLRGLEMLTTHSSKRTRTRGSWSTRSSPRRNTRRLSVRMPQHAWLARGANKPQIWDCKCLTMSS
jgi:hypothetical protein